MSESSGDIEQVTPETEKPDTKVRNGGMPLTIFLHWCKACGICISFCPHQVFTADRDGKPIITQGEKCTQCAICWLHCPDLAIVSNEK